MKQRHSSAQDGVRYHQTKRGGRSWERPSFYSGLIMANVDDDDDDGTITYINYWKLTVYKAKLL